MVLSRHGQATLLLVSIISVIASIFLMSSVDVFNRDYKFKTRDFDQVLLNEAVISTFSVMEAALARRMWEPPLGPDCLRMNQFSAEGEFVNGLKWNVQSVYNFKTKNYEMVASGEYNGLKAVFKKRIKVLDVSDYLLFSGSEQQVNLNRRYDPHLPSGLIARDRRVYIRGPLKVYTHNKRTEATNWSGSPSTWPTEFGTVVQGDRIQVGGGISYSAVPIYKANDPAVPASWMLGPYASAWGAPVTHFAQYGAGYLVMTRDYSKAQTLLQQVSTGATGPYTKGSVANEVYPIALFGGTPPLLAWQAADSGTYFNNPDRQSILEYSYAGANNFGVRGNFTCIMKNGGKRCSDSRDFPKGFDAWRTDAGLDGTLFTADAEEIPSPRLSWDNLNALEKDAQQCGVVISAPQNSYEDCQIWDGRFMQSHAAGGAPHCMRTSSIDMEALSLNNFNAGHYSNPALKERLPRRVIYLKTPAEIRQTSSRGLMAGSLSDPVARRNLALWVVSEDMLAFKGYQANTTSPTENNLNQFREVVFNKDVSTGAPLPPLSVVVLSPEKIHLLSPFYKPLGRTQFESQWPASGGKIRPVNHIVSDAERNEEDGFKYGFRKFTIEGVSVITSSKVDSSYPFFLRGVWSAGLDSSASQGPRNQCMLSQAGVPFEKRDPSESIASFAKIPAHAGAMNSPAPPPGSRFYGSKQSISHYYHPDVFIRQQESMGGYVQESEVTLTGVRVHVDFDPTTPAGKRSLSELSYYPQDQHSYTLYDLSHKHLQWDLPFYFNEVPALTACHPDNFKFRLKGEGEDFDIGVFSPMVNSGRYLFTQDSPGDTYRNIGSLVGVEQPVLETQAH